MDVGIGLGRSLPVSSSRLARLAKLIEDSGYHSIWLGEHVVNPVRPATAYPHTDGRIPWEYTQEWPEAMVTLGYLAGVTSTVRLGTSVIATNTRDPLSLAKQAATVDVLSEGRLELGLGSGWLPEEAAALGRPVDHPRGRLAETIEILRKAWTEPSFEYRGSFYSFDEVAVHPQPPQGNNLPIWIGGGSPRLVRLTAEVAYGNIVQARRLDERFAAIRAELAGKKVAAVLPVGNGAQPLDLADVEARAIGLRDAGADLLILALGSEEEAATAQIRWFAETLGHRL